LGAGESRDSSPVIISLKGTPINRTDLATYRDMILDIQSQVQEMIDAGKSPQEVVAANLTAPYDGQVPGGRDLTRGRSSADRFVGTLYAELVRT